MCRRRYAPCCGHARLVYGWLGDSHALVRQHALIRLSAVAKP